MPEQIDLQKLAEEAKSLSLEQCQELIPQLIQIMMQQNSKLLLQDEALHHAVDNITEANKIIAFYKQFDNLITGIQIGAIKPIYVGIQHLPQA